MVILIAGIVVGCATFAAFVVLGLALWELKDNIAESKKRKERKYAELLAAQIKKESEANTKAFLERLYNKRNK